MRKHILDVTVAPSHHTLLTNYTGVAAPPAFSELTSFLGKHGAGFNQLSRKTTLNMLRQTSVFNTVSTVRAPMDGCHTLSGVVGTMSEENKGTKSYRWKELLPVLTLNSQHLYEIGFTHNGCCIYTIIS